MKWAAGEFKTRRWVNRDIRFGMCSVTGYVSDCGRFGIYKSWDDGWMLIHRATGAQVLPSNKRLGPLKWAAGRMVEEVESPQP